MNANTRIPVTILTGFLGAGKTTLLNRLLHAQHGMRLAVIENEVGQEGVDADILLEEHAERIVQLDNGCLCCSVRGDLVDSLERIAAGRASGEFVFDHLVVETSGLADPGPVAQTFAADPQTSKRYVVESIVTVFDAVHGEATLQEHAEARSQLAYADRVLISKADLVATDRLDSLRQRISHLQPHAELAIADDQLDLRKLLESPPVIAAGERPTPDVQATHDSGIDVLTFSTHRVFCTDRIEEFFSATLQICGPMLLRCKGVLWLQGHENRMILQGVQFSLRLSAGSPWSQSTRWSKLVLIGMNLPVAELHDSLKRCLAEDDSAPDTPGPAYRPVQRLSAGWLG